MGDWYTIGLALGLGTALGALFAGLLSATPLGRAAAVVLAGAAGALVGALIEDWTEIVGGAVGGLVGAPPRRSSSSGALRRGGTRSGLALIVAAVAVGLAALAFVPVVGYLEAVGAAVARRSGFAAPRPSGTRACALLPRTEIKKLILVVIDGLTPSMLEDTLERGTAPALALLAEHGRYRRAISTFPSLTPVCLSSLATGAHPDVHEIPHLVWYHRGEQRLVEYGSSFGAVRAAGTKQSLIDTIYGLNDSHLGRNAVTVYEALEDAGLTAAAVNITCYRGRHEHRRRSPS